MISVSPKGTDALAVARRHAADPAAWPVPVQFDPVDRWYRRIAATADHEVWLLSWLPGQGTDLHDHGGASGGFVVVSGALTEETIVGGRLRPAVLGAGSGRRFGAHYVHRVSNRGDQPAVSLHVYRPTLRRMTRYELDGGQLRVVEVAEAGVAW
jgi:GNAT superfamily N-acetyltransferase